MLSAFPSTWQKETTYESLSSQFTTQLQVLEGSTQQGIAQRFHAVTKLRELILKAAEGGLAGADLLSRNAQPVLEALEAILASRSGGKDLRYQASRCAGCLILHFPGEIEKVSQRFLNLLNEGDDEDKYHSLVTIKEVRGRCAREIRPVRGMSHPKSQETGSRLPIFEGSDHSASFKWTGNFARWQAKVPTLRSPDLGCDSNIFGRV
jgi:hypothetical protein